MSSCILESCLASESTKLQCFVFRLVVFNFFLASDLFGVAGPLKDVLEDVAIVLTEEMLASADIAIRGP